MSLSPAVVSGLELWKKLSRDDQYGSLPPLLRLVKYVRDRSSNVQELLEVAFQLCEANLHIGKLEFDQWQGLAVIDATGAFAAQGLGHDLCGIYQFDFTTFLKALAGLAARSDRPAQYHQCINQNLFGSPLDDEVIFSRLLDLIQKHQPESLGWVPVGTGQIADFVHSPAKLPSIMSVRPADTIAPGSDLNAYAAYGRSLKWNLNGQVIVKSPFCCNVWLKAELFAPLYWLSSVDLNQVDALSATIGVSTAGFSKSHLGFSYEAHLNNCENFRMRLLATVPSPSYPEPGRAPVHYWMHRQELPLEAENQITVDLGADQWQVLEGSDTVAYGLKCLPADVERLDHRLPKLILILQPLDPIAIPVGSVSLPELKWIPSGVDS